VSTKNSYWNILPKDAGQIVLIYQPQLSGCAESTHHLFNRLRLIHDTGSLTWTLQARKTVKADWVDILDGIGSILPNIYFAIEVRQRWNNSLEIGV